MNEIEFGANKFCGPSAIAALVGCNTDTAEHYIQTANNIPYSKRIKGTTNQEMLRALDLLGFNCIEFEYVEDSTLFGSIPYIGVNDGMYLVNIPGHYITLETKDSKVIILDNHTKEPLNIAASARLGQRIVKCWKIEKRQVEVVYKEITYSKRKITIEIEADKRLLKSAVQDDTVLKNWLCAHVSLITDSHPAYKITSSTISTVMEADD